MSGGLYKWPPEDDGASRIPDNSPPEEAYGRVTNPERFLVLHQAMLDALARLEAEFDVQREEGFGLDEELERNLDLARPSVMLAPANPGAAPITVAFLNSPALEVRFGLWWREPFPDCMCDACTSYNSVEGSTEELTEIIEKLTGIIEDVTAGRFWESYSPGKRWKEGKVWGYERDRRHGSIATRHSPAVEQILARLRQFRSRGLEFTDERQEVFWQPWPHRKTP